MVKREAKIFSRKGKVFLGNSKKKKMSTVKIPEKARSSESETQNNSNQYENNESAHLSQLGRRLPGDETEGK